MSGETGRMRGHLRRMLPLAAALVALGALSGGGIVWARGVATEIRACVEPRTGYLVYGQSCGGASIVWSQEGPAGPAGAAGPQGVPGPRGAVGNGLEPPSAAEIQVRKHPPKGLRAVPGKPDLARLAKLKPSLGSGGVWAFSSFHDQDVSLASLKDAFTPKQVSHLDVPEGKYVVVAKADTYSEYWDENGFVACSVVAGVDTDYASSKGDSNMALTVVHAFTEPARIAFRCVGLSSIVRHVKITAIRVDGLKNVAVEAG